MRLKIVVKNKKHSQDKIITDKDQENQMLIDEDGLEYSSEKQCLSDEGTFCYMYNKYKPSPKHTITTK